MERRKQPYTISRPRLLEESSNVYQAPPAHHAPPSLPPSNGPRPLSDIRELSEPSFIDAVVQRAGHTNERNITARKVASLRALDSSKEGGSTGSSHLRDNQTYNQPLPNGETSSSYSSTPEQSSFYTIPYSSVPRRSSSQTHAQRPTRNHVRKPSVRVAPAPTPKSEGFTVPNHGGSHSPVKQAVARSEPVKSNTARRVPSRTYVRSPHPADILEFPSYRHPRLRLELRVSAPLFVGGGSIEGFVHVTVDGNERIRSRRSLAICGLAVDLLGFEDMPNGRRAPFLAIGTELIDTSHPPPTNMTEPPNPLAPEERFWTLTPSSSALPFMISLPLDTGPPPFQSKIANIRFLLCATALISDAGKHYRVRTSQGVSVIATYDPEKALTSLASPLTAVDELSLPRFGRCETLRVTAGLHRQVWVSGSSIFVDVHIVNRTRKPVKRLDLNLERDILCYKHPPAATIEKSASHARIFESNEQTMLARSNVKYGQQGWNGVSPDSSETRTCELELPRGHATVRCGKYFEVRFFLNVTVSLTNTKLVKVQLPIILIHMNSLDVLPNSVAQVAAAIEEKRARSERKRMHAKRHERTRSRHSSSSSPAHVAEIRRRPSYSQGRAFAAPRQQSAHRERAMRSTLEDLMQVLDSSPRKFGPIGNRKQAVKSDSKDVSMELGSSSANFGTEVKGTVIRKMGSNVTVGALSLGGKNSGQTSGSNDKIYKTPPGRQPSKSSGRAGLGTARSLNPLPRMQSVESMWSRRSNNNRPYAPVRDQNIKPQFHFSIPQKRSDSHSLSLKSSHQCNRGDSDENSAPWPTTGLSFHEKLDRKRFDMKGVVRSKRSGALKERGINWLDQMKPREKDKEGWI